MTPFQKMQRRIGGFPIEYPAAALMAAAAAFCTLALPDWRFEAAINATGLPGLISAAAPPLGTTARILAALGLGALSALAVWFGLRALDAKPQATDFPAFRAADLHPDAPRRRPILAGAEFGAPADDLPPIEEQIARRRPIMAEPMPSFLAPQSPEARQPVISPDAVMNLKRPEAVPTRAAPVDLVPMETAPDEEFAPSVAPRSTSGVVKTLSRLEVPPAEVAPVEVAPVAAAPVADARVEIERAAPVEPATIAPATIAVVSSRPGLPGDHDEEEESVGELMARLESGLTKRGTRPSPGPSGSAQEELRRALGDLNQVTGRS